MGILKLEKVYAYYGGSRIVRKLTMDVPKGSIVSLIGRNGVGKSTTLKSIMGLVNTPRGSIFFDGEEITKLPAYSRAKLGIGYVPQGRDIFPQLTVKENLEIALRVGKSKKKDVPEYIFELFPILPQFAKRKGGDLSGGQQQQLAIARALAAEPGLLILDEPTEGIQPSIIQDIGAAIRKINEWKGVTVLMVEQYLDFVTDLSDYIYVMEKGQVVLHGGKADLQVSEIHRLMTQ